MPENHPQTLTLSFHGAAGTVTGSKHLLTHEDTRVLLDAGMFQGKKELRRRNWQDPEFDPRSVDHVLLSHTHIDHVGYLPRLVKHGLEAPVHCTPAALELAELMLLDAAKIQEEDARYANKKKYSKHDPALPLYTTEDARDALELRRRLGYDEWLDLGPGFRGRFRNAGHILGSAFIELEAELGGKPLRIVYSADVGRFDAPLHVDPEPLPACDILLLESTYGDRLHTKTPVADQIAGPFREVLERRGTILIPAFAVGRSQIVALILRRMMDRGQLPEVPIHIDSPMAVEATRIYSHFLNERNVDPDVFDDGRQKLFTSKVQLHKSVTESKKLNSLKGPRILISPSGMMTGGRVLHHFKRLSGDPRNLIVMAGYQADGTRARSLVDGARTVKLHGRHVPVRCKVMSIHGLSGHADRDELLSWVASAPEPPGAVFLVHGEPDSSRALAAAVAERFGSRTFLPGIGDEVDLAELAAEIRAAKPARPAAKPEGKPEKEPAAAALEEAAKCTADPVAPDRCRQLLESPSYRRADRDPDFLQRDRLRAVRLQLEYLKTEMALVKEKVEGTVVVFGGSRIREPAVAARQLAEARRRHEADPEGKHATRELTRAERRFALRRYYDEARHLGRLVGEAGDGAGDHRLVIVTGGGPGIMEAANRGACDAGAPSIGLNITLPHEQHPNPYISPELCFQFRYFALRKLHFLLRARAIVFFPGGYGTLDELFESLCLIQTRKMEPVPVVLVGEEHWRRIVHFDRLAEDGLIDPEDVDLFTFVETAEEAWRFIEKWYEEADEPLLREHPAGEPLVGEPPSKPLVE
jgi:metallo-beta-lactamase family protein